jgi:hypothetical protein
MMRKLKLNLGDGGLQGWLVRHVEKFVLVLFVVVMVWFVVRGSRLEGTSQSPDVLKEDAQKAVAYVNAERWPEVAKQPDRVVEVRVEDEARGLIERKANSDLYRIPFPWNKPLIAKLEPRSDPIIHAPFGLKVVSIRGQIAVQPDAEDVDPLEPVVEEEDGKKPVKKPPKKATKKPATGMPGMMPGMPGMGEMPGMPGAGGAKGAKGAKGKRGKAGAGGAAAGMMGGMMPGMGGMMPGMGAGDEEGNGMPGMPGMGGMMGGMPGMGGPGGKPIDSMIIGWRAPQAATIRTAQANVVMALVPYEKQTEEFDAKLANSLDHDPARDKPHYLFFAVQRVDVTDDPSADPSTISDEVWKTGTLSVNGSLDEMQTWAGYPKDILDPAYLMPLYARNTVGLTQPLPPFVQRNLWEAMTHPEIPLAAPAVATSELPGARRPKKAGEATDSPDEIPSAGTGTGGGGMAGMAGMGMPGMGGPGMGGMPGMGGAGMGGAGMGGAGMGGAGMGGAGMGGAGMAGPGMAGPGSMPGMAEGGGMGMGMGMPGMPGGMGGMYGGFGEEKLVKYKLIRFNDFNVEEGRKYRYRVKVYVEDPNYPSDNYAAPSLAGLDLAAQNRVRDLEAKDAKSGKQKSTYLASDYSVASDVVTLPPAEWFYAGKVNPGTDKFYPHLGTATALTVVQDDTKHVDVPGKFEISRGSTLNFTLPELDVIHPAYGEKRKLEKYTFQTNAVVADMRGGQELPPLNQARDDGLTAPGEILYVDAAGNMHVRDEADDVEYFHRFVGPPEDDSTKKKKPNEEMPGFEGMFPGGAGGPGMAPSGIPGGEP